MEASDNVQPNEGQGESGDIGSFYDLSEVPDDYREHIEPLLKKVQQNVDGKFREHADYRKQWEPYESLNLNEYEPEDIERLLNFATMINEDEDGFKEWWQKVGDELGFLDSYLESDLDEDDDDLLDGEIDMSTVQQAISEQVEQALSPILDRFRNEDQKDAVQQANQLIDSQIEALKKEHGEFDEQAVFRFAMGYEGEDAVLKGFEDYQKFVNGIKIDTVNGKIKNAPGNTEGEGRANTNAEPVRDFKDAKEIARERLADLRAS